MAKRYRLGRQFRRKRRPRHPDKRRGPRRFPRHGDAQGSGCSRQHRRGEDPISDDRPGACLRHRRHGYGQRRQAVPLPAGRHADKGGADHGRRGDRDLYGRGRYPEQPQRSRRAVPGGGDQRLCRHGRDPGDGLHLCRQRAQVHPAGRLYGVHERGLSGR